MVALPHKSQRKIMILGILLAATASLILAGLWISRLFFNNSNAEAAVLSYSTPKVISSDIKLTGNQALELNGDHYLLQANVTLQDDATLIISNSNWEYQQSQAYQYQFLAQDRARVIIKNSKLGTSCLGALRWNFYNHAQLIAENVDVSGCSVWNYFGGSARARITNWAKFGGTACGAAYLNIDNSQDLELELCPQPEEDLDIELPVQVNKFEFPQQKPQLSIKDSTISGWAVSLTPNSDLTIRNSSLVTLGIIAAGDEDSVEISGLENGYFDSQSWQVADSQLRLINTRAKFGIVKAIGAARLTISDSHINGDVIATDNSTITIKDTEIDGQAIQQAQGKIITNSQQ